MAKRKKRAKRSKQSTDMVKLGHYSFFAGAVLAIIAGIFTNVLNDVALISILAALGVIVGLLNVTAKETTRFLVASVALMLAGIVNLGVIPVVGIYLRAILTNIVVFVVPAAVIVALRTVYRLAEQK